MHDRFSTLTITIKLILILYPKSNNSSLVDKTSHHTPHDKWLVSDLKIGIINSTN